MRVALDLLKTILVSIEELSLVFFQSEEKRVYVYSKGNLRLLRACFYSLHVTIAF